jgi:hypothetical protein
MCSIANAAEGFRYPLKGQGDESVLLREEDF